MNATFDSMMKAMGFKRCTCKECGFHSSISSYREVRCNLIGSLVSPTFVCRDFKKDKS